MIQHPEEKLGLPDLSSVTCNKVKVVDGFRKLMITIDKSLLAENKLHILQTQNYLLNNSTVINRSYMRQSISSIPRFHISFRH